MRCMQATDVAQKYFDAYVKQPYLAVHWRFDEVRAGNLTAPRTLPCLPRHPALPARHSAYCRVPTTLPCLPRQQPSNNAFFGCLWLPDTLLRCKESLLPHCDYLPSLPAVIFCAQ